MASATFMNPPNSPAQGLTISMKLTKWMDRFWVDFKKKEFISIKILFFLIYGALNSLLPFLTLHARSLGIAADELGIIYSLMPIICIFAPAMAGMFADKIGNFKIFLTFTVTMAGFASLLFLSIPPGRVIYNLPEELLLTLNSTRYESNLDINLPFRCNFNDVGPVNVSVNTCKYSCRKKIEEDFRFNETWCHETRYCDLLNTKNHDVLLDGDRGNANNESDHVSKKFITFVAEVYLNEVVSSLRVPNKLSNDIRKLVANLEESSRSDNNIQETTSPSCHLTCDAFTDTKTLCNNTQSFEDINLGLTMTLYSATRLFCSLTLSFSIPLFEGASAAILSQHDGDFGYQRMYGNLGMLVLTPISGKLIDFASEISGTEDFSPAFYIYCLLMLLSAFIITFMDLDFKTPSNSVVKDVKSLLVNPRVACFITFTLVSGTCWGFVETFLFWLLEDMKADKSLMGITVTVGSFFGLPLLLCSSFIIKRLGHVGTLSLSMAVYVVRLSGYSFIQNPWMAMPFEAMESFTNSLMGVTSVSYTTILSTPSTVASLQGIYGGLYNGVGRGTGSLIGGFLIKLTSVRTTFQILAIACAFTSVAYLLTYLVIFRRKDRADSENKDYLKGENGNEENGKELTLLTLQKPNSNKPTFEMEELLENGDRNTINE